MLDRDGPRATDLERIPHDSPALRKTAKASPELPARGRWDGVAGHRDRAAAASNRIPQSNSPRSLFRTYGWWVDS